MTPIAFEFSIALLIFLSMLIGTFWLGFSMGKNRAERESFREDGE